MSKAKPESSAESAPENTAESKPTARQSTASLPLVAAFAVVLLGGAAFGLTRGVRLESNFYSAMSECGARIRRYDNGDLGEANGLKDMYGLVQFTAHRERIARYMGFCETDPDIALKVFRKALKEGNASARMVASYSAFYLAHSKSLKAEDWELLQTRLNPERESDNDVRMVAQAAASDLILIKERPSKAELYAVPADFKETSDKAPSSASVNLRDFEFQGGKYYQVRWTSPALTWAWLQVHGKNGKWDEKLQRFVIEN
jgi:hypothetical protein